MRVVRRPLVGRSIADNIIHAREPQLLKLPIPVPSIPILAPVISPLVGGNNQNSPPATTPPPANTPPPSQPTPTPNPPPGNGGSGSPQAPPSDNTPSPGGDGPSAPVPPVSPGSGTGSGENPPSGSPGDSPTTGSDTIPSGGASPTSGVVPETGGGGTPSNNLGTADPATSGSGNGGVVNVGGTPQVGVSHNSGGTYTVGAGGSSSTAVGNDPNGTAPDSDVEKGGISTGAIAAIVTVFIVLFLALLILCLRRRSRARRDQQANTWWFSRKRTSQTYGDRNSAEIFAAGSRSARSSFATTVDHSFHIALPAETPPSLPPLPPMAEVGRANAGSLTLAIESSRYNNEVPDPRFSIGSNHSENSQYLFVNLRNSLQLTPLTGQPFTPLESFAFPKPPSPVGDRASAYSRSSSLNGSATMKRPNSDDMFSPSLPPVPPTPSAIPLTSNNASAADPFADNNPFEDPQRAAIPTSAFAEKEVIRRPFYSTQHDELTVSVGEYVHIMMTFDDGWAYVVKVPAPGSSEEAVDVKGLIPIDCLREPGQDLPAFIASKRVSSYGEGASAV